MTSGLNQHQKKLEVVFKSFKKISISEADTALDTLIQTPSTRPRLASSATSSSGCCSVPLKDWKRPTANFSPHIIHSNFNKQDVMRARSTLFPLSHGSFFHFS